MTTGREYLESDWRRVRRFVAAGALVLTMHIGGAAAALWQWPEDQYEEEPEGAMVLELAPMAIAPPEERQDLTPGPLAEDSTPTPPVEEIKEMRPEELPPVEEAPLAPTPEVALEKVKPVEEQVKEEEVKPQELVQAQAVASSLASAPPKIEVAARDEKAAAPLQGTSRKPNQATLSWQKALHLHLNRHKRYPSEARSNRVQGVVTVTFAIDNAGKILNKKITKGSGSALLDEEALEMLTRASPLPAPPHQSDSNVQNLSLPIQFSIK